MPRTILVGLPNAGTNYAFKQFQQCYPNRKIRWELRTMYKKGAWIWKDGAQKILGKQKKAGKHTAFKYHNVSGLKPHEGILLVSKHPLHWMHSMCHGIPYVFKWKGARSMYHRSGVVSASGLECAFSALSNHAELAIENYGDVVEMFNSWHRGWLESGARVVTLRYEDLLYRPVESTRNLCGAKFADGAPIAIYDKGTKHHRATNRSTSLQKYSNASRFLAFFDRAMSDIERRLDPAVLRNLGYRLLGRSPLA